MSSQSAAPGRILLADDDAMVARVLTRVLSQAGHSVQAASDGKIAGELLQENVFDVVLSDISMPGMSGLDLLRLVRDHDLDIPVLLMTGLPDLKTAVAALENGALRYLTKPIDNATLVKQIGDALRLSRLTRLKREALLHIGDLDRFVGDRAGLESRFKRALAGIHMVYQPIVDWERKQIYSYEALVRSREPGFLQPGGLLNAAERLGQVHQLGRAIRAAVAAAGHDGLLFVNLHSLDLEDEELLSPDAPLSRIAHRITLEITERAALDGIRDVKGRLEQLRRLGFQIAIDDLGAGYAGLTSFAYTQPDIVKLDMSLIRDVDRDATRQRIVGTMTSLCRELGMLVVAEGVETLAERNWVATLGCNLMQGFLFARPAAGFEPVSF